MKVALIGNLPEDGQESMQRFAGLLQAGMQARGHHVTLLAPTLRLARLGGSYRYGGIPKYLAYADKFVFFPRRLRRLVRSNPPDIVHIADHSNAVYAPALGNVPVLVTCHDLLQVRSARGEVPRQTVGRAGRRYQAWILASLARLKAIACVSSRTRADVLRLTGLPAQQVAVVPNALNYPYRPIPAADARRGLAALCGRHLIDAATLDPARGGFLLHVGGAHWYKNREGLLAIYGHLRRLLSPAPQLVMVGPPLTDAQAALAGELGVRASVVSFGGVTNPELAALYTLAEGLVFPSWEEGFGWPIAEAQSCGCPVFTSNRAPMTEVGGTTSVYFDPENPGRAAATIAAAWPGRAARRQPALDASRRWQPDLMLAAYEALYWRLSP